MFTKYGGTDGFCMLEKKVPAANPSLTFTPSSPTGFCYPRFLPRSPISLTFIYNPQDTPPEASQTMLHLPSHQLVINLLFLYLLLGVTSSHGSLIFVILALLLCSSLACFQLIFPSPSCNLLPCTTEEK